MTSVLELTDVAGQRFADLERAWNGADGDAFAAVFTEHADFVDIRGGHHTGSLAVGSGHQALFDSIYAGSSISYQVEAARVVAPGCIVAMATATLDVPTGPGAGTNRSRMTAVLTESEGRWLIAAFQNTIVVEAG